MPAWGKQIKIDWGVSFANSLLVLYPADDWRSYSEPRQGSEYLQVESGDEDAWIVGEDYVFEAAIRWIPTTGSANQTGWDGALGWRAFLSSARGKNPFRFFPDKDVNTFILSYLVDPLNGSHDLEPDGTRSVRIKIRNPSGSYDGY